MPDGSLSGTSAIVTGSSRGFGRETALSLATAGAHVVGVARGEADLKALEKRLGGSFTSEVADAADPTVAERLIAQYRPRTVVLNAGAAPHIASLHEQTWRTFSRNWEVDVRHAFNFIREALLAPLAPGSSVITVSSGAALRGSPLSGSYAGAKATIRFITSYAAAESERAGLGIRFVCVLPQLTPRQRWELRASPPTRPGRAWRRPPTCRQQDPPSRPSRSARQSPTWPPGPPTTRTPTCLPRPGWLPRHDQAGGTIRPREPDRRLADWRESQTAS